MTSFPPRFWVNPDATVVRLAASWVTLRMMQVPAVTSICCP